MADSLFWVIPKKLAGRAGPSYAPWDLAAIRDSGIATIVSADDQVEPSLIESAGLRHIAKYMPSAYPTSAALVTRFADLVYDATTAVVEELNQNRGVLVHCYAGRDRSGLILCATLMKTQNLSAEQALRILKAVRPVALSGPGVLDVLAEYETCLRTGQY